MNPLKRKRQITPLTLYTWEDFLNPGCNSWRPTYQQLLDLALFSFFFFFHCKSLASVARIWSHAGRLSLLSSSLCSHSFGDPHAADLLLLLPQGIWSLMLLLPSHKLRAIIFVSSSYSSIPVNYVIVRVGIGLSHLLWWSSPCLTLSYISLSLFSSLSWDQYLYTSLFFLSRSEVLCF